MDNDTMPAWPGCNEGLGPPPEPTAHALVWSDRGGEDIGWVDFYWADDKVPSDWDGPPPDEVIALFTAGQMRAYAAQERAAERERIINALPGGHIVDPQWVADMVRWPERA